MRTSYRHAATPGGASAPRKKKAETANKPGKANKRPRVAACALRRLGVRRRRTADPARSAYLTALVLIAKQDSVPLTVLTIVAINVVMLILPEVQLLAAPQKRLTRSRTARGTLR